MPYTLGVCAVSASALYELVYIHRSIIIHPRTTAFFRFRVGKTRCCPSYQMHQHYASAMKKHVHAPHAPCIERVRRARRGAAGGGGGENATGRHTSRSVRQHRAVDVTQAMSIWTWWALADQPARCTAPAHSLDIARTARGCPRESARTSAPAPATPCLGIGSSPPP